MPIFGYLFSGSKVKALNNSFRELFPLSDFQNPSENIKNFKRAIEIYDYYHALREQTKTISHLGIDHTEILSKLILMRSNFTENKEKILSIEKDFLSLLQEFDSYPLSIEKLKIAKGEFSAMLDSKLVKMTSFDFDKATRYAILKDSIVSKFGSIPVLSYMGQKKELETLVTTQVTHVLDTRLIDFYNNNKADAETLREVIKNKMKFPKEQFLKLKESLETARREADAVKEARQEAKLRSYELSMKKQGITSELDIWNLRQSGLVRREGDFLNEIKEASVLVGSSVLSYKDFTVADEETAIGEERKKKIDRIKIRLEDIGGGGEDVLKEYKEISERDQFLARELTDLEMTISALENLTNELKEKLKTEFEVGIKKINVEFDVFFKLMFGGGNASLTLLEEEKNRKKDDDEDEEDIDASMEEQEVDFEPGILINVSLPQKKVKALHALSGGERSLVSIALLFAMSQVNPPPFLVLDETDAALDEANSRKYGDMIEKLSEFSQLILVTHNRETMSRAGTLYGVTIASDGGSKILSVRLDEAVAIAK